jgi:hypothetical protein
MVKAKKGKGSYSRKQKPRHDLRGFCFQAQTVAEPGRWMLLDEDHLSQPHNEHVLDPISSIIHIIQCDISP